jgi:hypothetical protein
VNEAKLITIAQAAALLPGNPNRVTVSRYMHKGKQSGGQRVRLQYIKTHRYFTTEAWLREFTEKVTNCARAADQVESRGPFEALSLRRPEHVIESLERCGV